MVRPLVLLLLALPLPAQTFVVDANNGPGTHYLDIPPAIAQVPSGAVLRVRAGTYSQFAVANKSVTILGDARQSVSVRGFTVGPLGPAHRVVIAEVQVPSGLFANTLAITNAQGPVVLDSVLLSVTTLAPTTLRVQDSANVHLADVVHAFPGVESGVNLEVTRSAVEITDCHFVGPIQSNPLGTGFPAVRAQDSRLAVFRSRLLGGIGGTDLVMQFGPGGPGMVAVASTIDFGPGCVVTGGIGGYDPDGMGGRTILAPGGPGLQLTQRSAARAFATSFAGGCSAGWVFGNMGCTLAAAARIVDATSSFANPPGVAPLAAVQGVPTLNSFVDVVLDAGPGEVALLAFGFTPVSAHLPEVVGFGGILTTPELVFGPWVTDAAGRASFRLAFPRDFVLDRLVWGQFFTFPGLVLPGLGSNTVAIVVRS